MEQFSMDLTSLGGGPHAEVSELFRERLRQARQQGVPSYKLARAAGADATWLSRAVHGAIKVRAGDRRLVEIGQRLGLAPDQIFELSSRLRS